MTVKRQTHLVAIRAAINLQNPLVLAALFDHALRDHPDIVSDLTAIEAVAGLAVLAMDPDSQIPQVNRARQALAAVVQQPIGGTP